MPHPYLRKTTLFPVSKKPFFGGSTLIRFNSVVLHGHPVYSKPIPVEVEASVASSQLAEAEVKNKALEAKIKELEAMMQVKSPAKPVAPEPSETSKVSALLEQTLARMNALETQLKEKEKEKEQVKEVPNHKPTPAPSAHDSGDDKNDEDSDDDASYDGEEYITTPGGKTVPDLN